MSDDPAFLVRNLRGQPTELHLPDRVIVLPPFGEAGLSDADSRSPQLQVLARRRIVNVRPRYRRINLNTATATQLDRLPGISPAMAEAIVAYRTTHGPFSRLDDLDRVRGIGARTVEAVKDHVEIQR